MGDEFSNISADYWGAERAAEKQRALEESATISESHTSVGQVTHPAKVEELGKAACNADVAGEICFKNLQAAHTWKESAPSEGVLEGRVTQETPEGRFVLWIPMDDASYLKWVEGRYQQMLKENRLETIELRKRLYWDKVRTQFHKLIDRLKDQASSVLNR